MQKDNFKTDVIFRKEKDGSILAVFPYMVFNFRGNVVCYSHVGQHCEMNWDYLRETKPINQNDAKDLFFELESIGYNLNIIKKRNYNKYLKVYYENRG